jgi:single-stranded-DNA-specific exonuclease
MVQSGEHIMNETLDKETTELVQAIQDGLGVPNLFARILVSRGMTSVDEAQAFLHPRLDDLSDPFLLPDMEKGVDRVIKAIVNNEKISLYGDYDADGITSTAILVNFFKHLGLTPEVYLPKRNEGYGLNSEVVDKLKAKGTDLLICVDCGSSNVEEIGLAKTMGMDVVVIDHHEVPERMPDACAIINPKRKDSVFPTRELAACGVAFFFLWALRRIMHGKGLLKNAINLRKELDLVTLGTLGDMVPLVNDNRVIVKFGMENMRRQPRMWLKTFLRKNLISRNGTIDEYTTNFIIIPRINATGRVAEPEVSLRFLVSDDEKSSEEFLNQMNEANVRRQRISEEILREITETLKGKEVARRNSIVIYKEDWHIGVIGIVAQKLVDLYKKPSIVITRVDGICKGSGRGGDGLNLHETLSFLTPHLIKYGGHKYACGVSLLEENIGSFRDAFEERVAGTTYEKQKVFHVDACAEFGEVTKELVELVERLSPYGVGNPRPAIRLAPFSVAAASNGRAKITDGNGRTWFGYIQGQQAIPQGRNMDIIASPVIREEMGEKFIRLNIKDFMPAEETVTAYLDRKG